MSARRVVVLAAALALGALAARPGPAATPPGEPAPPSRPRVRHVSIARSAYQPARLVAQAGDTVVWTNADVVAHSASADDGKAFDSPDLAPRKSWRTVLRAKGTHAYHCAMHPTMRGTIVVR